MYIYIFDNVTDPLCVIYSQIDLKALSHTSFISWWQRYFASEERGEWILLSVIFFIGVVI